MTVLFFLSSLARAQDPVACGVAPHRKIAHAHRRVGRRAPTVVPLEPDLAARRVHRRYAQVWGKLQKITPAARLDVPLRGEFSGSLRGELAPKGTLMSAFYF